ncbi:MAG TPA: hypothetical protein VEB00_17030 [Clostridia bacterium]|nr:hypothetical protein [Clostridia bacterium]
MYGIASLWTAYEFINGALKQPEKFFEKYYTITTKEFLGEDNAKIWYVFLGVCAGVIGVGMFIFALYLFFFESTFY